MEGEPGSGKIYTMIKYLIDTNILVYAYDISEQEKRRKSLEILNKIITLGIGTISTQILAEFFVAVTKKLSVPLSKEEATGRVKELSSIFPVIDMNSQIIIDACQATSAYPFHYYDAQIWATAKIHNIPVILTEDLTDGAKYGEVQVTNPITPEFSAESL